MLACWWGWIVHEERLKSAILLFADVESCGVIKEALSKYEMASGQAINFQKSAISFSLNISDDDKGTILSTLGLSNSESHDVYLGLPSFVGQNKMRVFRDCPVEHVFSITIK